MDDLFLTHNYSDLETNAANQVRGRMRGDEGDGGGGGKVDSAEREKRVLALHVGSISDACPVLNVVQVSRSICASHLRERERER